MSFERMSLRTTALALVLVGTGATAVAQTAATPPLSFDDQKATLEAQTELVTKQLALRELLTRLGSPGMAGMPTVVAIIGMDGRLNARLQQANGVVSTYAEGDVVRAGMVVAAITPRIVVLKVGNGNTAKAVPLEFLPGAGAQPPGAGGGPGIPPLPPELLPAAPTVRLPQSASPALRAQPTAPAAPAAAPAQAPAPGAPAAAIAPAPAPGKADAPKT